MEDAQPMITIPQRHKSDNNRNLNTNVTETDDSRSILASTTTTGSTGSSSTESNGTTVGTTTLVVLFGTLNRDIADFLYQTIHVQLMKSLQALPMLDQDENDDKATATATEKTSSSTLSVSVSPKFVSLHTYLLKQYIMAVDLIELYNTRNTFSIHMIQPLSRQQKVLLHYSDYVNNIITSTATTTTTTDIDNMSDWRCTDMDMDGDDDDDDDEEDKRSDVVTDTLPTSMDQIPTTQDVQRTQEEIAALQDRLQQLHRQQEILTKEITTIQLLNQQQKENSVPIVPMKDCITKHISTTVPIIQTLRDYQNTSHNLQHTMTMMEQNQQEHERNHDSSSSSDNHQHMNINDIVYPIQNNNDNNTKQQDAAKLLQSIHERYQHDALVVLRHTGGAHSSHRSSSTGNSKSSTNHPNETNSRMVSSVLSNLLGGTTSSSK